MSPWSSAISWDTWARWKTRTADSGSRSITADRFDGTSCSKRCCIAISGWPSHGIRLICTLKRPPDFRVEELAMPEVERVSEIDSIAADQARQNITTRNQWQLYASHRAQIEKLI